MAAAGLFIFTACVWFFGGLKLPRALCTLSMLQNAWCLPALGIFHPQK